MQDNDQETKDVPYMLATVINAALILAGSMIGLMFKNKISTKLTGTITQGLALCVVFIGVSSAIQTADTMCMIISMVFGILIGETVDIEKRLDCMGEFLQSRFSKNGETGRFTEGFVTASLLYCVGSMAVMGALRAGIYGDYSVLISKGVLDGITSISFAAAMGVGVAFSVIPILLYQGSLTLIFATLGPVLEQAVVTEMSAVGGAVIFAIGLNMLDLGKMKIKVGNMLPAIFMPIVYLPISSFLGGIL